jgi:hypothetical protein
MKPELGETPAAILYKDSVRTAFLNADRSTVPREEYEEDELELVEAPPPPPPPAVVVPVARRIIEKPLEEIEVKLSGMRVKIPVIAVSVTQRGIAVILPPGRDFELDFEAELTITHKGKSHRAISFDQFHSFPSLDCSFVAFIFLTDDD